MAYRIDNKCSGRSIEVPTDQPTRQPTNVRRAHREDTLPIISQTNPFPILPKPHSTPPNPFPTLSPGSEGAVDKKFLTPHGDKISDDNNLDLSGLPQQTVIQPTTVPNLSVQRWEFIKKRVEEKRKKTRFWPRIKSKTSTMLSTKKESSFKILLFFFYKFPPQAVAVPYSLLDPNSRGNSCK